MQADRWPCRRTGIQADRLQADRWTGGPAHRQASRQARQAGRSAGRHKSRQTDGEADRWGHAGGQA
jgi:hypothetical protein